MRIISILAILLVTWSAEIRATEPSAPKTEAKRPGQTVAGTSAPGTGSDAKASATGAPATAPRTAEDQQRTLDQLQADLLAIQSAAAVSDEQRSVLKNDLLATAGSGARFDQAVVQKLAADLSSALAGRTIDTAGLSKLAKDLAVVMNRPAVSKAGAAIDDAKRILQAAGVAQTQVDTITREMQSIAGVTPSVPTAAPVRP